MAPAKAHAHLRISLPTSDVRGWRPGSVLQTFDVYHHVCNVDQLPSFLMTCLLARYLKRDIEVSNNDCHVVCFFLEVCRSSPLPMQNQGDSDDIPTLPMIQDNCPGILPSQVSCGTQVTGPLKYPFWGLLFKYVSSYTFIYINFYLLTLINTFVKHKARIFVYIK